MNAFGQQVLSSISGNIPKAILCVRKMDEEDSVKNTAKAAGNLQKKLLESTKKALASQTFSSLTKPESLMTGSGYLALEVQYNPSSIHMETQAGRQVQYSGGDLGSGSNNQIVQVVQPVSTTMSLQLIFDDMNPSDAFMLENTALTVGNVTSEIGNAVRNKKGAYSVQAQIDGLIARLTQDETRQVIFFWAKMCFRGELTSVNTRYTMFNKVGNPIRGVVDLTIRQGDEPQYGYDEIYWDQAFTKAFGKAEENVTSGIKNAFSKATNNNFLNLNL